MAHIKRFPDGFLIWEAEFEDKYAVISSFYVYDGVDYEPHMYDYNIGHPKYYCYLGEINGQVVSIFVQPWLPIVFLYGNIGLNILIF